MPNGKGFLGFLPTSWYEEPEWEEYKRAGGKKDFNTWVASGRPKSDIALTYKAKQALERIGYPIPPDIRFAEPTPAERVQPLIEAEGEAAAVGLTGLGVEVPPFPTEPPPEGFRYAFDRDLNRWVPQFTGLTAQQRSQQGLEQQRLEFQRQQFEFQQQQAEPQPITPFQEQQFGLQQQQVSQQQAQFQQQLGFQQQQAQLAAQEQERQYRSQLAANPINWLQYASYTGQPPVVQPWMVPLGLQGGEQQLQVGQTIPGFEGQQGNQQIQTFADLPQLRTPSAQLQARWGPTAQAQFLGFRQARTGASPEETQFRLGSQRAPTGRFGGFSRFR